MSFIKIRLMIPTREADQRRSPVYLKTRQLAFPFHTTFIVHLDFIRPVEIGLNPCYKALFPGTSICVFKNDVILQPYPPSELGNDEYLDKDGYYVQAFKNKGFDIRIAPSMLDIVRTSPWS